MHNNAVRMEILFHAMPILELPIMQKYSEYAHAFVCVWDLEIMYLNIIAITVSIVENNYVPAGTCRLSHAHTMRLSMGQFRFRFYRPAIYMAAMRHLKLLLMIICADRQQSSLF